MVLILSSCHLKRATDPVIQTESPKPLLEKPVPTVKFQSKNLLPGAYNTKKLIKLTKGKKVGLIVNHTSMVGQKHLLDTLLALNIEIIKIFAPEHGFKGIMEAGGIVNDTAIDLRKRISVVSLYGAKKQPSKEDLDSLDVLIFDIQDVGARFYTYITTLHYVMESCAAHNIPLIILDRPNPNGHYVDGFVLKKQFASFVGMHPIPVVHGLTIGELAGMINGEGWLKEGKQVNLTVVRNLHYSHKSRYIPPVPPSPNLKDFRAILLYPSTCFFEGTAITEGRGTESPFVQFGHPGIVSLPHHFTPKSTSAFFKPRYQDTLCFGLDLSDIPMDTIRAQRRIDLSWLLEMYALFPDKNAFFLPGLYFDKLAGTDKLRLMIIDGKNEHEIRDAWQDELNAYKTIRKKYLLYKDFE